MTFALLLGNIRNVGLWVNAMRELVSVEASGPVMPYR